MQKIGNFNLCELCFAELDKKAKACPYCDGVKNIQRYPISLKEGTVLAGRYCIGKILGKGGFGITYLAYDLKENKKVAIKEYMPDSLAYRTTGATAVIPLGGEKAYQFKDGAKRFFDEAKLVSHFYGNPNIIGVYEFFDENNTTYFVMEYLSGMDMKDYIVQNGVRSEGELLYILDKVTQALSVVHGMNTLHRDISPDNIFLCENGAVKLIDFGAARNVIVNESNGLSVILKHGFAPKEQYYSKGKQGPWTDIYALGASVYYGLTGKKPEDALSRYDNSALDLRGISPQFAHIIEKMMEVDIRDRYCNVLELRADLAALSIKPIVPLIKKTQSLQPKNNPNFEKNSAFKPVSGSVSRSEAKENTGGKKWLIPVIAGAVCLSLVIALIPIVSYGSNKTYSDYEEVPFTAEVSEEASSSKFKVFFESEKEDIFVSSDSTEDSLSQQNDELSELSDVDETLSDEQSPESSSSQPSTTTSEPHTSHSFTTSKVTKEPTITSTGVKTYYCSCGATKTETIPKLKGTDWKYSDGTLTIFGNGPMENYYYTNDYESTAPWMEYVDSIEKVVIEKGITSVGDYSFLYCYNITSVTIPNSVTSIGEFAFATCFSLKSVTIPNSVKSIGYAGFFYCSSLTSVTIPNSVKSIDDYGFYVCENLKTVTIQNSKSNVTIGSDAFADCHPNLKITYTK